MFVQHDEGFRTHEPFVLHKLCSSCIHEHVVILFAKDLVGELIVFHKRFEIDGLVMQFVRVQPLKRHGNSFWRIILKQDAIAVTFFEVAVQTTSKKV